MTVSVLPSLDPSTIFPLHLLPSPVHLTGFYFCFPLFLVIFILPSNNSSLVIESHKTLYNLVMQLIAATRCREPIIQTPSTLSSASNWSRANGCCKQLHTFALTRKHFACVSEGHKLRSHWSAWDKSVQACCTIKQLIRQLCVKLCHTDLCVKDLNHLFHM